MMARPIPIATLASAGLLLLTAAHAYSHRRIEVAEPSPRNIVPSARSVPAGTSRCAIRHARFGGRRAQLISVTTGSVANYVVIEVGKRDPLMPLQSRDWLHATYGDAERVWIGEFGSAEAALARASRLCPPSSRCWPGEPDCGPQTELLTPAQTFFRR